MRLRTTAGVKKDLTGNMVYHDQDVFEANDVTVRVLELCHEPKTREDIVLSLCGEYDVQSDQLEGDLSELIPQLLEARLLEETT